MNNPILKMSNTFRKIISLFVMFAFVLTGFGPSLVSAGHTIEGSALSASVTATPNSGTRTDGQTVQVDITLPGAVQASDTNPFSSPSCLVNGVNVASTFTNLTDTSPGGMVDGKFRFTYTVGTSDADRTAGSLPIDCTIRQSHDVHLGAFTDSNTVAIDASGTTAADTTAPTVTSTNPSSNATNVALNSTVQVTFSEAMNASTLNTSNFTVRHASGGAAGSVTYSGNTATFTPQVSLVEDTQYTATITTGAEDVAGNAIASQYSWSFTTVAGTSTNSGPGNNAVIVGSGAEVNFPTSAVPSSGTLTVGQTLEVHFTDSSATSSTTASSTSCLVNGVNVASSFERVSTTVWKVTYTVGAGNSSATAGNVTIDCTIVGDQATLQVIRFNDSNTVAIDASGSSSATAPSLSGVSISPSSGTVQAGDTVTVTFTEADDQTNLSVTGSCKVNAVNIASSFVNNNNGTYTVTYTVGANDGERPAGHIPLSCTLGNSAGNVTASAWMDSNTLAIDTNNDGAIDNGTNNLGFTVSASPSSGTVNVGGQIVVSMQDPLPSPDVTIVPEGQTGTGSVTVSNGCKVNNVDVSGSYAHHGNGLYKVTYTVSASHADRAAGQVPFDCTLSNHTGTVHLVSFTDNNTVAINASASTDTTPPTVSSTSPANGATNVGVGSNITATFSEEMNSSTLNTNTFTVTNASLNVAGSVTYSGNTAIFNPTNDLSASTEYTAHITTGAEDSEGNAIATQYNWSFTTAASSGGNNTTPTLESIAITTPATKLNYTVGQSLDISGLVVTGTYSDGSTQVQSISTSNITGFNSSSPVNNQVLTITVNGKTTTYTVNIAAEGTETTTLNNSSSSVTITSSTTPVNILIASGTTNPTINLSSLITAGTGTLPAISIVAGNAGNVEIEIPAGTVVTSSDLSWNEILNAPTTTTVTLPTISGQTLTLSTAIELGFSGSLTFNKAVRILLPGQAGKKVGYVRPGISFTEITATCSADTQTSADTLGAGADCKIDVGADLVIWTKHFTTFATYSQSTAGTIGGGAVSGGGGGGGGGGAVLGAFTSIPNQRIILGCDIRSVGFSTVTGESCALNIPNALTSPVNLGILAGANTNIGGQGQVLGAASFRFTQTLRRGSQGDEVRELQNFLNKLGYNLVVDGKFGLKTRAAVIAFQRANGLVADGVVGTRTRAALNIDTSNS